MLSRVADALYWIGRYLERAENITRLLLVTEDFSTEVRALAEDLAQTAWKDMLAIYPNAQVSHATGPFTTPALTYLAAFFVDAANPYSVHFSIRRARENARSVREALTLEVFLTLNEAYRMVDGRERRPPVDRPGFRDALTATHRGLFAVMGAVDHTLPRDQGWHFLRLGGALERAYRTALILRAKLPALLGSAGYDTPLYYTQWRTLLRSLACLESYRKTFGARLEPDTVIPFLLFDPHLPRSLRFEVASIKDALDAIAGSGDLTPPARLVGRLLATLCYDDVEVTRHGDHLAFLDRVADELGKAHDALGVQYFVT